MGGTTAGPGLSVVNVYLNYEKKFAFVEFRTVEEASNAMALDGIMFEGGPVRWGEGRWAGWGAYRCHMWNELVRPVDTQSLGTLSQAEHMRMPHASCLPRPSLPH